MRRGHYNPNVVKACVLQYSHRASRLMQALPSQGRFDRHQAKSVSIYTQPPGKPSGALKTFHVKAATSHQQ
jgi:hypothetical protein